MRPLREVCFQEMQCLVLKRVSTASVHSSRDTRDRYLACCRPDAQTLWREGARGERDACRRARDRRRSRRRGDLAPDCRRRRAAREHNTARAGALIGTDPKQPPNPMASSADPRCAACRACRKKEGGRGKPCVTIGLARFPRVPSKRSCLAVFVEIHESAAAKFWVGNPGTTYPGDTTPMAWEASAGPGLEDPPGPRLIDVCTAYEEIRLRGACSNLVRCCPRRCPVRCGGIRGLEFYLLTL